MALNTEYQDLANQMRLNNSNALFGSPANNTIAGMSGDLLQQWAMLGANSKAYDKMLQAEKTGSIKQGSYYTELLSDKYFNDYYDAENKKIKKATYSPVGSGAQPGLEIAEEDTSGDILDDMRSLALAAISNPNSLNSAHYDFFEKMRASIASNLVTKAEDTQTVVDKEAQPATITKDFDERLLLDDQTVVVAGSKGEKTYNFGAGTSIEEIAAAINADAADTGVKAEFVETDDGKQQIRLTSAETGKKSFVRVDQTRGDLFAEEGKSLSATGTDETTKEVEETASGEDTQAAIAAGLYTGKTSEDVKFTIQGRNGDKTFSFNRGATAEEIVAAINEASEETGVKAEVIRNAGGDAEGIGLLANRAGSENYVQVKQEQGTLFANEGRTVSVAGSSIDEKDADAPAINSLSDLGKVNVDGVTYSFADLSPGGKASLANNPDVALAILDQALQDIYDGKAEIKGFDPAETYRPGMDASPGRKASTNTLEFGNYGSDAISDWIGKYVRESEE